MNKTLKRTLIIVTSVIGTAFLAIGVLAIANINTTKMIAVNLASPKGAHTTYEFKGEELTKNYGDTSQNQNLSIYIPQTNETPKLMVLVHGGGFVFGNKDSYPTYYMRDYFSTHGYAVASINYRLSGEAIYPACIQDVKSALTYLTAHADEFGYDANNIIIYGESAGGYLATMASVSPLTEYCPTGEAYNYHIGTLLDFYGVIQMETMTKEFKEEGIPNWVLSMASSLDTEKNPNSFTSLFVGGPIADKTESELSEYNPMSRIGENTNKDLNVFITHGTYDITVPHTQSVHLANKFKECLGEDKVKLDLVEGYKHGDDRLYSDSYLKAVDDYLKGA